jgi:hypothetical protein
MTLVVNESAKRQNVILSGMGEEANASEPLMTCRNTFDVTETRCADIIWDKLGGCLLTARVVTGIKAA